MTSTNDSELSIMAVNDDNSILLNKKFVTLLSSNHSKIYSYILMLVPSYNEADDIMQECSLVMLEKFNTFKEGTDFVAWGITIAKYQVLNYLKKKKRDKHIFDSDTIEALDSKGRTCIQNTDEEWFDALRKCLSKLNSSDFNLIKMWYYENLGIKSVTDRLGWSFQKVYRNLSRVNALLVECVRRTCRGVGC